MKATDTRAVVVLDTNVYRRLGRGRDDPEAQRKGSGIASRDSLRGVQALLHPFVILELVSHLANVDDHEWTDCRAALIVAWHHCQTESDDGSKFVAVINDSETAICRLAYQLDPPGHALVSERLATLCKRVATSSPDEAKSLGHSELALWSKEAAEIENEFVSDMMQHIIREHIPGAVTWDALKKDPVRRREALEIVDSTIFVREMAEANVRKAQRLLSLNEPDPHLADRIDLVASTFQAPFELYRAALRRVIVNGVDVSKTKYRNWVWDLHIAFSIGDFTVFGHRPVQFVTNDQMILDAAAMANLEHIVRPYEQYSNELRTEAR